MCRTEENLSCVNAALALPWPTPQRHTHTNSQKALFSVPIHFPHEPRHSLRILLNTELLTSVNNWPMIALCNKTLCSPYTSLELMGSMFYVVRGRDNRGEEGRWWSRGKGHRKGKLTALISCSSMCGLTTSLWSKQRRCIPWSGCNWASGSELPVGCIPSWMTLSKIYLSLWALA